MIYEELIPAATRRAFTDKVRVIASKYGFNPEWLMIVMRFETGGSFRTGSHNNGAYGLIGFRATVANELGTNVNALSAMSQVQQLDYVDKYLAKWNAKGKVSDLTDLYMIVFTPAYAGKPDSFVVGSIEPNASQLQKAIYNANPAFRVAGRNYFNIGDIGKVVAKFAGTVSTGSISILLVLILSAVAFALYNHFS